MKPRKNITQIIADMDHKNARQAQLEAEEQEEAVEKLGWIYRQLGVHQAQVRFNGFEADRAADGIGIVVRRFGRNLCGLSPHKAGVRLTAGAEQFKDFVEPDEALARICEMLDADHKKLPYDVRDINQKEWRAS